MLLATILPLYKKFKVGLPCLLTASVVSLKLCWYETTLLDLQRKHPHLVGVPFLVDERSDSVSSPSSRRRLCKTLIRLPLGVDGGFESLQGVVRWDSRECLGRWVYSSTWRSVPSGR